MLGRRRARVVRPLGTVGMVRQISVSNPPGAPSAADAPDLGRWLTHDLRVKGTPLSSRPPPLALPESRSADSEQAALAGWLTRDLTPKHSAGTTAALTRWSGLPRGAAATGKSLPPSAPHSLTAEVWDDAQVGREAPPARMAASASEVRSSYAVPSAEAPGWQAVVAASVGRVDHGVLLTNQPPAAIIPVALEEDDLSVLPGRGRVAAGSARAKLALALLLGLLLLGIGLVVRLGDGPSDAAEAANDPAAPSDNGVLLPPPPAFVAPPPAEATESAHVPRRGAADADEPDGLMDPRDPRFSLGGPSVRRYADVASPTLSRLAREQRRLARERDEAIRNAKAAKPAKP